MTVDLQLNIELKIHYLVDVKTTRFVFKTSTYHRDQPGWHLNPQRCHLGWQVQDGSLSVLAIKLTFRNKFVLKILGISANLNDILNDPNDKYLLDQVQDGYWSWISLTGPSNWYSKIGSCRRF